jgi:hypothetical protein
MGNTPFKLLLPPFNLKSTRWEGLVLLLSTAIWAGDRHKWIFLLLNVSSWRLTGIASQITRAAIHFLITTELH